MPRHPANLQSNKKPTAASPRFHLIANHLAVDFCNTVVNPAGPEQALGSWEDLVDFLETAGVVERARGQQLRELAVTTPESTEAAFRAALALRGGIREGVEALADGRAAPAEAAERVNEILRLTEGYDRLLWTGEEWRLRFVQRERRLEWLLAAIARSAAELFVRGPGAPVRKCANPECILYFLDTSRTGERRWCSMAACGNRHKVAAFTRRQKEKSKGKGKK